MNTWTQTEAVLTLRDGLHSLESTGVAKEVQIVWPTSKYTLTKDKSYVIFVHGYNNSYGKARASYATARWWLEHLQTSVGLLELHWPGDSKRRFVSKFAYAEKIGVAETCGETLARWIARAPRGTTFSLIGHSLGCRLVLCAVKELRRQNEIHRLKAVCLMAAAVPVSSVVKDTLGPVAGESLKWRVLFSRGDGVLTGAFPLGQTVGAIFYRNTRFGNEAVGLTGEPQAVWRDRWELYDSRTPVEGANYYGHSWYWPGGRNYLRKASRTSSAPEPHDDISGRGLRNNGDSSELLAELLDGKVDRQIKVRRPIPARSMPERLIQYYSGLWI